MYRDESLKKYLDDLAARLPAPGGGSAAALSAAMGAALISMVVNFTLGKSKYVKYERELKEILKKSEKLRERFLNLIDLDILAYQAKDLKKALKVSLKVCRFCSDALNLCPGLVKKGNINLISDTGIAAVFLEAAFISARINVDINLKSLDNEELTRSIRKELSAKEKIIKKIRKETEARVGKIIRG
ncbi:MAG: cyclodeaminase/cyclohydrolase family protein [Candidatus Omnitrophota bacterium]|nr:cyclodeaminase/cyclohydrolase family protein [Candidatus Omnitrophota bacterium]